MMEDISSYEIGSTQLRSAYIPKDLQFSEQIILRI